ncbi:hypothetical protein VUR80DRAFT_3621 [Thermomyces stellatus]
MGSLPPGWDLDYDGSRWFYRYRPSGLTQYTFPKEGDEFPDFVDAGAPAPALAPEEKLESQQQVKRRGDSGKGRKTKSSGMGATGGPASVTWDDDDDDGNDYGYFQPENFMYLGPCSYTDVSPLADESDADGLAGRAKPKDVSPSMSRATTDAASDRVTSPPVGSIYTPQPSRAEPAAEYDVVPAVDTPPQNTATPAEPQADQTAPSDVPMLDSRDRPHELPEATSFNPVGVVPEMATEDTAKAYIELHPDPVEMGDNSVLAPIETFYLNVAELPSQTSPVERKEVEPPPQRRRAASQPLQRVYPFQPREDDDPDRPPTPLGSSPAPAPSPQPPTAQPKTDSSTPDIQESRSEDQPPSTSPQELSKITRKSTDAGTKPGLRPLTPELAPVSGSEGEKPPASVSSAGSDHSDRSGQADSCSMPAPLMTGPKQTTSETGTLHTSTEPFAEDADSPPPVPAKIPVPSALVPGQPTSSGSPSGLPRKIRQRPHSISLPGSPEPLSKSARPDVLQHLRRVPQSLQPGTPSPLPVAVPGKEKTIQKPRATPSPLGFEKRTAGQAAPAPGQPATVPGVTSTAGPLSGHSPPEQPISTPSSLEIRSSSSAGGSNSSSQSQVNSAEPSLTVHPVGVAGPSSGDQEEGQHQKASQSRQGALPQGQLHAAGSYFPPQPSRTPDQLARSAEKGKDRASPLDQSAKLPGPSGGSTLNESQVSGQSTDQQKGPTPHVASNSSPLNSQQAALRPREHQQAPPVPSKQPLPAQPPQAQAQPPAQPAPLHDSALGHFLDPITEQPEHEDSASLARKASLASQASSHRHSMPVIPSGDGNVQDHSVAPCRGSETAQPNPQSLVLRQQQGSGIPPTNPAQPPMQPRALGIPPSSIVAPQRPMESVPVQPNFQQHPAPGMYAKQPIPGTAGPPAGKPSMAQALEKGKSKWLSKLLKSSKTSGNPPPQQQYVWNGPVVIPLSQSPAPGAPWSPGSVGATPAPAPSGGEQARGPATSSAQGPPALPPQPVNAGQKHQRQGSGALRMVPTSLGQTGQKPPAPAPAKPENEPIQASRLSPAAPVTQPGGPLSLNPVVQAAPPPQPGPIAASQPDQGTTPRDQPRNMEQAQSPSDAGPARTESVKSTLTASTTRTESVRSEFTTISTSEAQPQPVLKPRIVQVSRPPTTQNISQPPHNGSAPSLAPQTRFGPPQSALNLDPNGRQAPKQDGLRMISLHVQNGPSAEGSSARESMISEVSSADSADSRRVSGLSTGSATPRKKVVKAGDYSGGGWGGDV